MRGLVSWGGGIFTHEKHYYALDRRFLDLIGFLLLCDLRHQHHLKTGFCLSWDAVDRVQHSYCSSLNPFFSPPLNKNKWTTRTLLTPERLEISEMLALKEYNLLSLNNLCKLWTADGRSFKKWLPVDKDTLPVPNLWMLCPGKLEKFRLGTFFICSIRLY